MKEKINKAKEFIGNLWWFLKWLYSIDKVGTLIVVFVPLLIVVGSTVNSYIYARILDKFIQLYNQGGNWIEAFQRDNVFLSITLAYLGIFSLNQVLRIASNYFKSRIIEVKFSEVEGAIYNKVGSLTFQQFHSKKGSDLVKKVTQNQYKLRSYYNSLSTLVESVFHIIVNTLAVLPIAPFLALISLVLYLPEAVNRLTYAKEKWGFYNDHIEESKRVFWLQGFLNQAKTVAEHNINKANSFLSELLMHEREIYSTNAFSIEQKHKLRDLGFRVLSVLRLFIVLIYFINSLLQGRFTVGTLTFLWGRISQLGTNLGRLFASFASLVKLQFVVDLVRKLFKLEPTIKSGSHQVEKGQITIEFKNVWFKYPETDKWVLKDMNLKIGSGQEVAIVGENGAGKTTLIYLILRFYEPTKGRILINGVAAENIDLDSYYRKISTLFQDFNTYGCLSTRDNVTLSDWQKEYSEEELESALEKADALEFVEKLDNKYDQTLSNQFEGGTELSKGQWQKLALARIFYRDAGMIILDEPTSSIDATSEYKIFNQIYDYIEDKTVIIISHRFSTVRNAEKIFVLKEGEIVERGSHKELMSQKGIYEEAYNLQAEGYN